MKPKLIKILEGKNVQCFKLSLKLFPPAIMLSRKKMTLTVLQIALHQIWLNRNLRKHKGLKQNTQASLNCMDNYFRGCITW